MKRNIRFRKMWNSFVTFTIWEMESPVISWIFTVPEIMKENFQSCLTCTEAVFSLGKKKRDFSSLLYLRETLEKEFVLSIYKSGKQRNYPKPATVISGHSLWRYSSKLQQTVCKSDNTQMVEFLLKY